jgi:hypothetical protein
LRFDIYKYQVLQQVTIQEIRQKCGCNVLSYVGDGVRAKFSLVKKPPPISPSILTDITLNHCSSNPHAVFEDEGRVRSSISLVLHQNKNFWSFFFAECTVTGVVYLDMLEEFVMPIFEERALMTCYLQD